MHDGHMIENRVTPDYAPNTLGMRKKRQTLKESGIKQHKFSLRKPYVDRLDSWRDTLELGSRERILSVITRIAVSRYKAEDISPVTPTVDARECATVVVNVAAEHVDFLQEVARRYPYNSRSRALEAVMDMFPDLAALNDANATVFRKVSMKKGRAVSG